MSEPLAVLDSYPPECHPTRVESLGSAGGMSGAQFWRITAPRGVLALRRWPAEFPSADRLAFIHAVLRHAAKRGIDFLPIPATTQTGHSFIFHDNHFWELAPWMPGIADYEFAPTAEKPAAAMRALAQFHTAVADFPSPFSVGDNAESPRTNSQSAIHRHTHRLQQLFGTALTTLTRSINETTWPALVPIARQFVATLPESIPSALAQLEPLLTAHLPLQPCLRDIWHDHLLFTGDEVTGLIDFGAVDIDTPATDIARLIGSLEQGAVPFSSRNKTAPAPPLLTTQPQVSKRGLSPSPTSAISEESQTWQQALTAYQSIHPLSPSEIEAAYALAKSGNILAGCNWIRWIYIEGRHFDDEAQVVERFRRIAARVG